MSTKRECPFCCKEFDEDEITRSQEGSSREETYTIPTHKRLDPEEGLVKCQGSGTIVRIETSNRSLH